MRRVLWAVACVALMWAAVPVVQGVSPERQETPPNARPKLPAPLTALLPRLANSKIPVFLPAWLPPMQKSPWGQTAVVAESKTYSYSVTFWMDGSNGSVPGGGHCGQCLGWTV